jgi:hypothetical protein
MTNRIPRRLFLAGAMALGGSVVRAAQPAWPDERTAGVFRIHADFSLEAYGELIDELASLQDDLVAELGIAQPREEVHLFLFERKVTYQAYLQQYFPKVPARKALYIKGRGPGMVFAYRSAELAVDVRHEATHALLHASIDEIPLWLDEGLAEYFEVSPGDRAAKNPYVSGVRWNVRLGYIPSLDDLQRLRDLSEMGKNEYRDAWAWTHYLLHGGDEPRAVLRDYLAQLGSGQEAGGLKSQLDRRIVDPEGGFTNHFRRWKVE